MIYTQQHTFDAYSGRQMTSPHVAVAKPAPHHKDKRMSLAGYLRIAVGIAELIAIVAIEVFSAGTATPGVMSAMPFLASSWFAPVAIAGVGVLSASANLGIDASEGYISYLNLGINLAAAILPIGVEARFGAKALKKIETTGVEAISTRSKAAEQAYTDSLDMEVFDSLGITLNWENPPLLRLSKQDQSSYLKWAEKGYGHNISLWNRMRDEADLATSGISKTARDKITRMTKKAFQEGRHLGITEDSARWYGMSSKYEYMLNIISPEKGRDGISTIRGLSKHRFTTKNDLERLIAGQWKHGDAPKDLLRAAMGTSFKMTKNERGQMAAQVTLDELFQTMTYKDRFIFGKLNHMAGIVEPEEFKAIYQAWWEALDNTTTIGIKRVLNRRLISHSTKRTLNIKGKELIQQVQDVVFVARGLRTRATLKSSLRYIGSAKFNRRWVQRAQLIDPNDMGRAPIEWLYQHTKEIIDKKMAKVISNRKESLRKFYHGIGDVKRAWKKSGGTVIKANRYLIGYKVLIPGEPFNVVLLKFNKFFTKGTGYNANGKPDIIIRATDKDLALLSSEGVSYYWDVGKKKHWRVSNGGKRRGSGALELSGKISLFLSFIPVPALRNLLSIGSNWVENVSDMASHTYFKQWVIKFKGSITRASLNRTGRLASRVVLGGLAKSAFASSANRAVAFIGRNAGRELQRFTSLTLHQFEGRRTDGGFKFKVSKSTTTMSGAGKALGVSLRSGLRRNASSRGRALNSFRVKAQQVRRIPGAITPNRIFNPKKLGKIKV